MTEDDPSALQGKLAALAGAPLADADVAPLLAEAVHAGAGVTLDVDGVRFRLLRRDGKFVIKKDDPRSPSTMPPPMRRGR